MDFMLHQPRPLSNVKATNSWRLVVRWSTLLMPTLLLALVTSRKPRCQTIGCPKPAKPTTLKPNELHGFLFKRNQSPQTCSWSLALNMGTRILKCIKMLHLLQFIRQEFVASKHTMMPYTGKPARRGNKLAGKRLVPCRASGGSKGAKAFGKKNHGSSRSLRCTWPKIMNLRFAPHLPPKKHHLKNWRFST